MTFPQVTQQINEKERLNSFFPTKPGLLILLFMFVVIYQINF